MRGENRGALVPFLTRLALGLCLAVLPLRASAQVAPTITQQPANATRSLGDGVTFSVNGGGTAPLRYQWSRDGVALAGATNRMLTLSNLILSAVGEYRVRITNSFGALTSGPAMLDVDGSFRVDDSGPAGATGIAVAVALTDFDNDNALDISASTIGQRVRLFRNTGAAQFAETNLGRLTQNDSFLLGVSWADVNNDGFSDALLLRGFSPPGRAACVLLQNNGGQGFTQLSNSPVGVAVSEWSPGLWGDFNRDGWLDLYLGATAITSGSIPAQDFFFLSDTQGRLTRQTQGVVTNFYPLAEYSNGGTASDLDGDGRLDIVILASARQPRFLRNLGGTNFTVLRPFAFTGEPDTGGSPIAGDFNNDGRMDVLLANVNEVQLFLQQADGSFVAQDTGDLAAQTDVIAAACSDYDNDGWLDIFTAVASGGDEAANNDGLWRNNGDGTFSRVTRGSLSNDGTPTIAAVWGDLDNNGFEDLFATFDNIKWRRYLNQGNTNHWLTLKLQGTRSNRSALGAKVRVRARIGGRDVWQLRELNSGWGYALQGDPRPHFGLGDAPRADVLRIEWPSGFVQEIHNVTADRILTLTEPRAPLRLQIARVAGQPQLTITGDPGQEIEVQTTADCRTWTRLTSVVLPPSGMGEPSSTTLEDTMAATASVRFYRAVANLRP